MVEKKQFRAIKGVRDILPPESAQWNRVEQAAREVFEAYGYGEILLPILEEAELFSRSVGTDTDIVSKEMFSFDVFAREWLFHWRHEMINAVENPVRFTGCLYHMLKALENAWESQQIDRSVTTRRSIESLRSVYKFLYDALAEDRNAAEANHNPEIKERIWDATKLTMLVGVERQMVVLRPEATASVCRAYIEHGMRTRPGNVKLYYIGPMFRRERPQKGRYRQFYQIGAEVLTPSPNKEETAQERIASAAVDAEVIEMLLHFFTRIGLEGCTLYYNSIGCRECRPKYVAELRAALEKVREQLGADSQRRIETNPLRVLDSKVPDEQAVIEKLPRIGEHLCAACREHLAALKEQFTMRGIEGAENWRLVRGLDYYMRTTFEITAPGLGSQNAVCGGGRYDGLVELLGGLPTKGIGFAIGTDRVMLSLAEAGKLPQAAACDVFVAWLGAATQPHAIRLARKLRDAGFAVEVPPEEMKFRKSLDLASRLGARYALIIGENEVASGRYGLKRLADGTQRELTEGELVEYLIGSREAEKKVLS